MRSVLTMAMKDLTLMRRDWLGLFFIVGFPVVMGVFFGLIAGSFSSESASLAIAVVDEDMSRMSNLFVDSLIENENVDVHQLEPAEALNRARSGKLVGVIVIPKGFGETAGILWVEGPAIQVGTDPSRRAEAGMLQGLVMQSMGQLIAARFQDPAAMRPFIEQAQLQLAEAKDVPLVLRPLLTQMMGSLDSFMESLEDVQETSNGKGGSGRGMPAMQIAHIESIDVTREYKKGSTADLVRKIHSKWDISFPQGMLWGVLGCAAGFAITMVRERTQGTFLRLQVAPVTRAHVFAGKATACFLAVLFVIVFMVMLGTVLGMRPESTGLLAMSSVCIAFCFVGVMMLMSVIGKTEEAVSGAAWFANIMMAMFGGGMIPLAFMPSFMKTLSHFSPVKWSILALEGSIWRQFTFTEVLTPCAVLLAIGAVSMAAGIALLARAKN